MAGEWAQIGGDKGGTIVFEAAGKIDLRQSQTLIPQRIVAGKGVVAITRDGAGQHTVHWAITGRAWKKPMFGSVPVLVIGDVEMRNEREASVVYESDGRCLEPTASFGNYVPKKPGRQLWFAGRPVPVITAR